jgi:hypothetical protein
MACGSFPGPALGANVLSDAVAQYLGSHETPGSEELRDAFAQ